MFEKIKSIFSKRKKEENDNDNMAEQRRDLILGLKAVFVIIPLLKPYNNEKDLVKIPHEYLNIISKVLNSEDNEIIQNKLFFDVKLYLEEIIENEGIFRIDNCYLEKTNIVENFCYSLLN